MKILSPAGNFESLKAGIFNGADEVYLGINDYNARNNIDGFDMHSLQQAVDFAHVYNCKVNLAINILFDDSELQKAFNTIVNAYNIGVDSFIIQDLGLAYLIHTNYPEIELHASTQMGIHNLEGVKFLEKFSFKRVVLARETPIEEIKRIRKYSSLEIEYFAQGALCVSFSGNCYLSSYLCNASGNRGRCKQLCRLPYSLEKDGKSLANGFLLSAKDFNLITRLQELKDAGVDVIKIEGRARRPFYVATATKEYYNALHGKPYSLDSLKLGFNRDYTAGYFDGNHNIISKYNNHIGLYVGKVKKVVSGKKFNEIYISSSRKLEAKSTFKFFSNSKETATLTAYDLQELNKNTYRITTTQNNVKIDDKVHLIIDAREEQNLLSASKKQPIDITLYLAKGKPIKALCTIHGTCFDVYGDVCQEAKKQPLSAEELINNFGKNDLFSANLKIQELENVFLPKQQLNQFRRNVFSIIYEQTVSYYRRNLKTKNVTIPSVNLKFKDFQIVETIKENFTNQNIIYSPEIYDISDIKDFYNKCLTFNKTPYLDTPNFALKEDIELLSEIIKETNISIIANNYYALEFNTDIIIGAGLNVYNSVAAEIYNRPIITAESEIGTRVKAPVMTLRHCPLKNHLKANCLTCPYSAGYTYKMEGRQPLSLKRKKLTSCTFYLTLN